MMTAPASVHTLIKITFFNFVLQHKLSFEQYQYLNFQKLGATLDLDPFSYIV